MTRDSPRATAPSHESEVTETGYGSSAASSVIVAFSSLEMGHVARAASACSANCPAVAFGTLARVTRCTLVTVCPASVFSRVTVAVVLFPVITSPKLMAEGRSPEDDDTCELILDGYHVIILPSEVKLESVFDFQRLRDVCGASRLVSLWKAEAP